MGEAEADPDAPRISSFKFISRPKLKGDCAQTAQTDVQKILDDARESINERPAPIQIKLCKNHHVESTGKHVQVRSWEDLIHAAKRIYNITAKRVYTKTGKIIFNFTQVKSENIYWPFLFHHSLDFQIVTSLRKRLQGPFQFFQSRFHIHLLLVRFVK